MRHWGTGASDQSFEMCKMFGKQPEKVREIRLSERLFHQRITDIYAMVLDYDKDSKFTRMFFAKVKNKLHFAVHGNIVAEIIYTRKILGYTEPVIYK